MKRAFIIGLGCLLFAGCAPDAATDADPGSPLLRSEDDGAVTAQVAVDPAPADGTGDNSGGVIGSVTICPACKGHWSPPAQTLEYSIPPTDGPVTMTLVLLAGDGSQLAACPFEGKGGEALISLDCKANGVVESAALVFPFDGALKIADIAVDSTIGLDPPIVDVQ